MFKLLIVDDEKLIRDGLVNYIDWTSIGVEIVGTASNGEAALTKAFENPPDIILSDIKMPTMDGIELIKNLREYKLKSEIIFISAYSNFEYAQSALKFGAFDYILKPIEENLLIEVVLRCIDKIKEALPQSLQVVKEIPKVLSTDKFVYDSKLVNLTINYIHENFNKNASLADIATKLYITPSYLSKLFSEEVGESFSKYLLKYRIKIAKGLLGDYSYKVYEVSQRVGYADVTHFTKVFKEIEGISPTKYRNQ